MIFFSICVIDNSRDKLFALARESKSRIGRVAL